MALPLGGSMHADLILNNVAETDSLERGSADRLARLS